MKPSYVTWNAIMPEAIVYVVATNAVGPDAGGSYYFGHSMIVNPIAWRLAQARSGEEIIAARLDPDPLRYVTWSSESPQVLDHLEIATWRFTRGFSKRPIADSGLRVTSHEWKARVRDCGPESEGLTTARDKGLWRIRGNAMSITTRPLQELVQELPSDMHAEVRDFVEFLLAKRVRRAKRTLRQDWAGALRNYRQQYTSLELQRQALTWRGD